MQDQALAGPTYDIGHYLRPVGRHRALMVACVLVGLLLGTAFTVLKNPTYTAAARVQVDLPVTSSQAASVNAVASRTSELINPDTEAQIATSIEVATLARAILKTPTAPGSLLARVSVSVPPNSTILRIACTGSSPRIAQACADAFANAYLKNRTTVETKSINDQITAVNGLLAAAQSDLSKIAKALVAAPSGTPAKNALFTSEAAKQQQIENLNVQHNQLASALPVDAGRIVSAASPGVSSKTSRLVPPILGLVLGFLIAAGAIFGRERLDRYVRHSDDLAGRGVGLIAEIQPSRGRKTPAKRRRERIARTRFDQRVASVVAGAFDADGGVVYVAAVSSDQREDDVAAQLAGTLASVGHHVEIVRAARIEMLASEPPPQPPPASLTATTEPDVPADGYTPALLGWPMSSDDEPEEPSTELVVPPSAEVVEAERATLSDPVPMSIRMRVEAARRHAQFVIIDGEPAVSDAQAYILAGLSDATVLVVDPEATLRDDLEEVVDQILVAGSELLGAVIWRPWAAKSDRGTDTAGFDRARGGRSHRHEDPSNVRRRTRSGSRSSATDSSESWPPRPVDAAT